MIGRPGHGQDIAPASAGAGERLAGIHRAGDKEVDDVHLVPRGESSGHSLSSLPSLELICWVVKVLAEQEQKQENTVQAIVVMSQLGALLVRLL